MDQHPKDVARSPLLTPGLADADGKPIHHTPALTFDPAAFAHFVADFDLTEAQRDELLQTLWGIMVGFVDLGFHIHPVQQAKSADIETTLVADSGPVVSSGISFKFNRKNSRMRRRALAGASEDS